MKPRTALAVVLTCACPLFAQMVQGTVTAPNVVLEVGQSATIDITVTGPVSILGYNLNLQIGDGCVDQDIGIIPYHGGPMFLGIDEDGPGTVFHGKGFNFMEILITPQLIWAGGGSYSPPLLRIDIPAGTSRVLARVQIEAGLEPGTWPLALTTWVGLTDYADDTMITIPLLVDGSITIVPEPASLVLLLTAGGLALGRRR